ncbi:Nodule Cysteine-Rich (NCR) secreted peptide [Medicago truncatula]|uniref:Nodule Cysteine-Rich (NCR) secreted peptide n=2 Tax=Medicago truncatula TaxID=3880 RepID=G7IIW2_MEDTR|nr:Nodule Cysteine-Rich (NCR) secreted peptide [Medicago truncatula]
MVEILKCFYVMITFLFLFFILTDELLVCESDEECPKSTCLPPQIPKCLRMICECV